ncbi:MAG TPA: carboxymuconolactone decarboxylase family protein [Acidimicrobiia bacterium]
MPGTRTTSWLPQAAAGATSLERVFGLVPATHDAYRELDAALWDPALVDPALVELCRLRVAQLVGCDAELPVRHEEARAAGLDDAKIDELRRWPTSPLYSDADRAVLNFAEKFVVDASSVDDHDCAALRAHLSDPEIAALTTAMALFDAMARFQIALGVDDR